VRHPSLAFPGKGGGNPPASGIRSGPSAAMHRPKPPTACTAYLSRSQIQLR